MLLTAAMSASVLAGCGSGQTGAQQAEPAAAEETAAEGETTAPQQEEAAAVELSRKKLPRSKRVRMKERLP